MANDFTLKCNKCGSESILTLKFDEHYKGANGSIRSLGNVKVGSDAIGEMMISCKCGNEIYDGYENPQKGEW